MAKTTCEAVPGDSGQDCRPSCFGDPSRVCPKDADGIIQPQAACVACRVLKDCLQQALRQEGLISPPSPQSQVVSKATHFLRRWSHRKLAGAAPEDAPDL